MKRKNKIFWILFLITTVTFASLPWGFYAHKKANRYAVFTLPEELIGFYKKNIDYIGKQALLKIKDQKPTKKLLMFTLDESKPGYPLMLHDEPIYFNDKIIEAEYFFFSTSINKFFFSSSSFESSEFIYPYARFLL